MGATAFGENNAHWKIFDTIIWTTTFIVQLINLKRKSTVDLLSFDAEPLYFDNPPSEEVVQLLQQATEDYSDEKSEADLQRAY